MTQARRRSAQKAARLRAAAFHEAGHAAVLWHFGLPTTLVNIVPGTYARGQHTHPPPLMLESASTVRERRQVARQMILSTYAGMSAQRLVEPSSSSWHEEDDDQGAFELSMEYGVLPRGCGFVGDEEHTRYLNGLRREAARLVKRLSREIEALAEELMRKKKMTGAQVAAFFERMTATEEGGH